MTVLETGLRLEVRDPGVSIPLWFALYREALTPQQERDGFRSTILRGSAEDLQAELARRCRTRRLPLPPP